MQYFHLLRNFFKLRANTKKSRAEVAAIQEIELKKMILHAYDHSAFHRKRFEESGITREQIPVLPLSVFPTMDKFMLLDHFDEIVTVPDLHQEDLRLFDASETEHQKAFRDRYHVVHSSGSTGKPGYFVYDNAAWSRMLIGIIRGALWDMTTPQILKLLMGARIAYIAATDGRYGGAMAVGGAIEGLRMEQLFLDINTPLAQWIQSIKDFRPNIIIGYPSAIKILGELVEQDMVHLEVTRVISCGEPLGTCMRSYLEKVFRSVVVNFYGASESLALGVETGGPGGMVLFDDLNVIEVEDGCMYLTSLYNMVQPLIRYQISDRLVLKEEESGPFTRAEILMGREEDMLWFEDQNGNRDFLHPLAIEGFCIKGLLDYQFHQTSKGSFEMLTEVSDPEKKNTIEAEMHRQMGAILREKRLEYVRFTVRFVDAILPDPKTGKKRLITASEKTLRLSELFETPAAVV